MLKKKGPANGWLAYLSYTVWRAYLCVCVLLFLGVAVCPQQAVKDCYLSLVIEWFLFLCFFSRVFGTSMVEEYEEIADPPERPDDQDDDLGNNLERCTFKTAECFSPLVMKCYHLRDNSEKPIWLSLYRLWGWINLPNSYVCSAIILMFYETDLKYFFQSL